MRGVWNAVHAEMLEVLEVLDAGMRLGLGAERFFVSCRTT
jgi:hypothetical protein